MDINRLQRQLVVHSIIYYRMNSSIWTDAQYDAKSKELIQLMKDRPKEFKDSCMHELFKDYDGSTGYHLCTVDNVNKYYNTCISLLDYQQ